MPCRSHVDAGCLTLTVASNVGVGLQLKDSSQDRWTDIEAVSQMSWEVLLLTSFWSVALPVVAGMILLQLQILGDQSTPRFYEKGPDAS